MHILVAANDEVLPSLEPGAQVRWVVPKSAEVGDTCVLSHWGLGLYAFGEIESEPEPVPDRKGKYTASIANIAALAQPVPLSSLSDAFPAWKWPSYPRSYTTIEGELEAELSDYLAAFAPEPEIEVDDSVSPEGAVSVRLHRVRERDPDLIDRKKAAVIRKHGTLACEVCGFNFALFYGAHGTGFAEVHHLRPLSWRDSTENTTLEDLAIVCSNCHRMLHRKGLVALSELRRIIKEAQSNPHAA